MRAPNEISLDRGWILMLRDIGINPEDVLRRANLPLRILHEEVSRLTIEDYFAALRAVEELADDDPLLALHLGQSAGAEAFSAPIFAALCSSNLLIATQRIAKHKRLTAPMQLVHDYSAKGLTLTWVWDDPTIRPPRLLMTMELVFLTRLARLATREPVRPVRVTCPAALEPLAAYSDFFGVEPSTGPDQSITFSTTDAHRPFLTASETLWASFEPELRRRTESLDTTISMAERTRSVLLECLPSREATLHHVAQRLGVSSRTLQRRLAAEGATFRDVMQSTREHLAHHYLLNTTLPHAEIAFLLGFDEASSFFRAFHEWSGTTPQSVRVAGY